ncbi:MAG TPA: 5'-nucleotidase C-terminal domain-containing protein [Phototrophicaceae bacterium]|nr:5'-nucleotidase C-terminal domain-containing protein [Phototrophicaceae bacterium]
MSRKVVLCLALILMLVASVVTAQDETFKLTIMHTNDTHAGHDPQSNGNGGVAREAAVVKQIRGEAENSLLLDAGDRFTGSLYHTQYLGQDQVQIMNLLGYDAMTLGNHEFDNGDEVLAQFLGGLKFPVVNANLDASASPVLADKFTPSTILEVGEELVGVIGLTTAETPILASPGVDLVWNDDYVAAANAAAADLTAQGVNKIILMTHTGVEADLAFVPQLENIDVVIGGHSHTLLSNTYSGAADKYPVKLESASGQPVYYVQAGEKNIYLGRLDVQFDAEGVVTSAAGDTILLSRYITPDTEMSDLLAELSAPIEELKNTSIDATTEVLLVGDRAVCRVEECNLGNLMADGMRAETGAQIAIMNSGGIRASIEPGDITLGDVLTVQPFGNLISTFEAKGADVIAALENGVSTLVVEDGKVKRDGAAGRFPQVSGIRYVIDPTKEAGSRIVSVEVLGENGEYAPIDPEAIYSLVTINFVRTGGDGYSVFAENAINPYDFGKVDYESLVSYLKANSPITAADVEGRITYENAELAPLP